MLLYRALSHSITIKTHNNEEFLFLQKLTSYLKCLPKVYFINRANRNAPLRSCDQHKKNSCRSKNLLHSQSQSCCRIKFSDLSLFTDYWCSKANFILVQSCQSLLYRNSKSHFIQKCLPKISLIINHFHKITNFPYWYPKNL